MRIDEGLLQRHRRLESTELGISEEFLQPKLGLGQTVAVLSRPLGPERPTGWVVCHSFGLEQMHLSRLDVLTARALSASGFPVLRYHGQGYGDAQGGLLDISLSSHLDEGTDAVRLVQELGVKEVGVLGPRLGGLVAGLLADRMDLPFLGLWEPVNRGSQYMREFLRTRVFSEMVESNGEAAHVGDIAQEIATKGWSDIKGFPLSRRAFEEVSAVDLARDMQRFRGRSLLVSVSRAGRASPSALSLARRLKELGGECTERVVQHPMAPQFGQFHFQTTGNGLAKRDTQLDLFLSLASITAEWAESLSSGRMASAAPVTREGAGR